jgi:hypothetical protein
MRRLFVLLLVAPVALAGREVHAGTAAAPTVRTQPRVVRPGTAVTITGSHFRPRLRVTLSIRGTSGKGSRIGVVEATAAGAFRFRKTISRSTVAGVYVVRACQRSCRTKATTTFLVPKIKPV